MEKPTPLSSISPTSRSQETIIDGRGQPSKFTKAATPSWLIAQRFGVDLLSASSAALLVSPIICIIDRGIIENASGRNTLMASMKSSTKHLFTRPHRFILSRPFGLIYMLYFGTYATANSIDTGSSIYRRTDMKTVTAGTEKFVATTGANMGLCLYKDRNFTRMFGTTAPRPLPFPSYLLFSARDTLTIFFSFNLPPLVAPYMPQDGKFLRPETYAQLLAPAVCQLFSTPLHLLGLDLYNREGKAGVKSRWDAVKKNWIKSSFARMGRIIPAFGFGGVTNAGVRRSLLQSLEQRQEE